MTTILKLNSSHAAAIDALRSERASAATQALGVVGFALLTVLGAQARIYLWEVPFSLQTLAVYGSGLYLGWRNGALAQLLYLSLGLLFPVFAGDSFGPAYLFGAVTAGYLLAYPLAAAVVGALSMRWNALAGSTVAMLVGSAVFFTFGVVWLHYAAGHATWFESIDKGWLRFIPVDLAKVMGLALLYQGTRRLG